jgi:hypothetical protein
MAGTKSYESINQVLNAASNLGPYQIVEGRIDTFDCKRQPSTRLKYQYEINGFNGSVEFVFYFGALAETRFHPDDPQSFFKSELNEFPKHRGQEKKVGNKIYWTEGRNGIADTIGIADDRLIEQFNRWARNYN